MKRVRQRRQRRSDVHDLTTAVQALTTELRAWREQRCPPAPPAVVMPMEGMVPLGSLDGIAGTHVKRATLEELLAARGARRDRNDPLVGLEGLE